MAPTVEGIPKQGLPTGQTIFGTPRAALPAVTTVAKPSKIGKPAKGIITKQTIQAALAGVQVAGILKRGKEAEIIAKERAAVDIASAEAIRRASVERAKILAERGERFTARQKFEFISAGIRTNVGVPLLVETQTRRDIAADIGFDLEVGRAEAGRFLSSAEFERRIGKERKRRSRFEAIGVIAERGLSFLGT